MGTTSLRSLHVFLVSLLLAGVGGCCCNGSADAVKALPVPEKSLVCEKDLPLPETERVSFVHTLARMLKDVPADTVEQRTKPIVDFLSNPANLKVGDFDKRLDEKLHISGKRPMAVDATQTRPATIAKRRPVIAYAGFWFVLYIDPAAGGNLDTFSYKSVKVFRQKAEADSN